MQHNHADIRQLKSKSICVSLSFYFKKSRSSILKSISILFERKIIWQKNIILLKRAKEMHMICIFMEGEELKFTVKEAKEIADKLVKCANE